MNNSTSKKYPYEISEHQEYMLPEGRNRSEMNKNLL